MLTKWAFVKKPGEASRLDYTIDLAAEGWLTDGDTIASVDDVTISEPGSVEIDGADSTTTVIRVWLIGGEDGDSQHVSVSFTTAQGRKDVVCFDIRVKDC